MDENERTQTLKKKFAMIFLLFDCCYRSWRKHRNSSLLKQENVKKSNIKTEKNDRAKI